MLTCEIVLAAALLTAPKDVPMEDVWLEVLRPTIIVLAINEEILDPRERSYLLTRELLTLLQDRNEDFKNYPKLDECQRYPERKVINTLLGANVAFRDNMKKRLELDVFHIDEIRGAIAEADQLYYIWDTLRDAQCEYYYVTIRRQALRLLRDSIGDEEFYSGKLPLYIPIRHLPRS
jgi:hypothetical protein